MAGQSVYKITTDQGTYNVTVDDSSPASPAGSPLPATAAITAAAVPTAARVAAEIATNPNVPRLAASAGRAMGAIAPIVGGTAEGGPLGGLIGVGAAAKGAWAGGKAGWFTGKLAQNVAAPVANGLEAIAPYASAFAAMSGVQGEADISKQAAEDMKNNPDWPRTPSGKQQSAMSAIADAIEKTKQAIADGTAPSRAALMASGGSPSIFAGVMSHFMKSGGIK